MIPQCFNRHSRPPSIQLKTTMTRVKYIHFPLSGGVVGLYLETLLMTFKIAWHSSKHQQRSERALAFSQLLQFLGRAQVVKWHVLSHPKRSLFWIKKQELSWRSQSLWSTVGARKVLRSFWLCVTGSEWKSWEMVMSWTPGFYLRC